MTQQTSWRCGECEAIVTAVAQDGRVSPSCPVCGAAKESRRAGAPTAPPAYDARAGLRFAETAGPELDKELALRVLGGSTEPAPPYSSEDWAAMALAELVGRQSAWSFHLAFCGDAWMATFTERGEAKEAVPGPPVSSFVSATGATRALAIARALTKVVRCPRWRPLGDVFLARGSAMPNRSAHA